MFLISRVVAVCLTVLLSFKVAVLKFCVVLDSKLAVDSYFYVDSKVVTVSKVVVASRQLA